MAAAERKPDMLLDLLMDPKVIELTSTLVSKLERIRYDETRRGVFRTRWCLDLFTTACKKLNLAGLSIDEWFADVIEANPASAPGKFEINPAKFMQDVETNWLAPLLAMEQAAPGFIMLFHNILELEDKTHIKIAESAKKEDQYDFLGLGSRNKATAGLLTGGSGTGIKFLTHK